MDYPLIRSNFIEENLLRPWCNTHTQSQIVLLGAGLDTRAYKFKPLQDNSHVIYEIDFPIVIDYKEKLMQKRKPLCNVVRLSADLVDSNWSSFLIKNGFSKDIPTFWVLEGLVYYIEREAVSLLLTRMAEISKLGSQIFIDIIHTSRLSPFPYSQNMNSAKDSPKNQKWSLNIKNVPEFFATTGWEVESSLIDEINLVRNVGEKGMVFIQGIKV